MSRPLARALALGLVLVGSITLDYAPPAASSIVVAEVEVPLGALAAGSSGGLNGTEGTATVTGTLLSTTTSVLHLNNTNASGAWYARLETVSTSGLANLVGLTVGIDNGTLTPQVVVSAGSLTQSQGPYVRLEPASTNRIYVTQTVALLGLTSAVSMRVVTADDESGSAYVVTTANVTVV